MVFSMLSTHTHTHTGRRQGWTNEEGLGGMERHTELSGRQVTTD